VIAIVYYLWELNQLVQGFQLVPNFQCALHELAALKEAQVEVVVVVVAVAEGIEKEAWLNKTDWSTKRLQLRLAEGGMVFVFLCPVLVIC
jgi:hypothetical protein